MDYDLWLWGKSTPFCSLTRHMIAVGACVYEYLSAASNKGVLRQISRWMGMPDDEAIALFSYVSSMHDIGKAHPGFQKNPNDLVYTMPVQNFRHERYGAERLDLMWREMGWDRRIAGFYAAIVGIHHQGKGIHSERVFVPNEYDNIQRDIEHRMRMLFQPCDTPPKMQNADALGVLLSAVLIICDWVASSKQFAAESLPLGNDSDILEKLRERSRIMLRKYGLISDASAAFPRMRAFSELWPTISVNSMRPLQRTCEQVSSRKAQLTIIEAPMGEGKTEAALYLAGLQCEKYEKRGVYMALPTSATSNQMVMRVRALLEAHQAGAVRLLHSTAWLIDDKASPAKEFDSEDAECVSDWLRPLRRGMLSENAVGTVDQAMASALKVKYGVLRLAGLAGKVLVIDEIHAYDIFMSTIIARLLEWCRALEIPVILLSATMQDSQKRRYLKCYDIENASLNDAYPLITQVTEDGQLIQTPVNGVHMRSQMRFRTVAIGDDIAKTADLAQERAKHGGCICVMMNTVRQAQAVYRELRNRGEEQVMLFHARYAARRRTEIEKNCIRLFGKGNDRPERMILVCTQVVEQSLDVDFDAMITQLAPMDLLLQRAGRVHRHANRIRPKGLELPVIDVIVPEENAAANIEERYVQIGGVYSAIPMKNTEELLGEERSVSIPENVRTCVELAYRDISEEELMAQIRQETENQLKMCEAEAGSLRSPQEARFFAQTNSNALALDMEDCDDGLIVRGARTRDGGMSQQFVFLPKDFPINDGSKEWLKESMEYCCTMSLTKIMQDDIMKWKEMNKGKCEKIKCIEIRADDLGLYRWMNHVFSVSDEYGVEEVST